MDLLLFFQANQNPVLNAIFEFISLIADKVLIIAVVCFFYWCYDKKVAHKVAIGYFLSGLAIQMTKITFRIPRPWVLDSRIKPSAEMLETATGYSFPSGHTQTATSFCYSLLTMVKKHWLKIVLIVFPFLMMLSRMYVLVHSPLDVTVSFVMTSIIVFGAIYYLDKNYDKNLRNISWLLVVGSIIGFIYAYYLVQTQVVPADLGSDAIEMMGAILGYAIGCLLETKYLNFEIKQSLKPRFVTMVLGLIGTIAIKSGLKLIVPDHMVFDFIRYFLTIFWVMYIYPYLFTKFKK